MCGFCQRMPSESRLLRKIARGRWLKVFRAQTCMLRDFGQDYRSQFFLVVVSEPVLRPSLAA